MSYVVADIQFFDKGGRRGPLKSGYRATIHLNNEYFSCIFTFKPSWLELGEKRQAVVNFSNPTSIIPYMKRYLEVEIAEGKNVVGKLFVKEVCR